jgi:hypothetical protein
MVLDDNALPVSHELMKVFPPLPDVVCDHLWAGPLVDWQSRQLCDSSIAQVITGMHFQLCLSR